MLIPITNTNTQEKWFKSVSATVSVTDSTVGTNHSSPVRLQLLHGTKEHYRAAMCTSACTKHLELSASCKALGSQWVAT